MPPGAEARATRLRLEASGEGHTLIMIALALLLIVLGLLFAKVLFTIGLVLLVIGLVLNLTPVGGHGRRWY